MTLWLMDVWMSGCGCSVVDVRMFGCVVFMVVKITYAIKQDKHLNGMMMIVCGTA